MTAKDINMDLATHQARNAPILIQLERVLEFIGKGRPLTPKGNLRIADGETMAYLFDTNEVRNRYGRDLPPLKSSTDLGHFRVIYAGLVQAGALVLTKTRVVPGADFAQLEAVERVRLLVQGFVDRGLVFRSQSDWTPHDRANLLERFFLEWIRALPSSQSQPVKRLDQAVEELLIEHGFEKPRFTPDTFLQEAIELGLTVPPAAGDLLANALKRNSQNFDTVNSELLLDPLSRCGLVTRTFPSIESVQYSPILHRNRGVVSGTELSKLIAPQLVDPAIWDVVRRKPGHSAVVFTDWSNSPDAQDPPQIVQAMAAEFSFLPQDFVGHFSAMKPASQHRIIERIWDVDLPHTTTILDHIAQHHPESEISRAARKAVMKHRTKFAG